MPGEIMTEVSAIVPGERAGEVPVAFAEITQRPLPDGLLRTELLEDRDGEWKIQSLWRDQAALDAMRAGAEPPAAPALFRPRDRGVAGLQRAGQLPAEGE